jgi:hypothetical protein
MFTLLEVMPEQRPEVGSFAAAGQLANWKGTKAPDGLHIVFTATDEEGEPFAPEGEMRIILTPLNETTIVEQWQVTVQLTHYNETGTAKFNLATDVQELLSYPALEVHFAFKPRDGEMMTQASLMRFS